MTYAIGFDVYGTLTDPLLIAQSLRPVASANSDAMAQLWRSKQLEYSFRRAVMGSYQSFDVCNRHALQYAAIRRAASDMGQAAERHSVRSVGNRTRLTVNDLRQVAAALS